MNSIQAIILGIVQGLAEFLPVSSSGHLVLLQRIFGIEEGVLTFDVAVHIATLAAVIYIYRSDIAKIIRNPFGKLPVLIVVSTIPTVIIGFAFRDFFENMFKTGASLGIGFIFTGLIIWYADSVKKTSKGLNKTTYIDAVIIGIAQGIAIFPAVSRSGLTISGALFRGLRREFTAKYILLLSIPSILGAAVLDLFDITKTINSGQSAVDFFPVLLGMAAAAVSGYIAIRFLLKVLKKGKLKIFSYYVFALGILVILEQLFIGRFFGRLI